VDRRVVVTLAAKSRLPAILRFTSLCRGRRARVLWEINDVWRCVASYVDKILKGASPAELLVEQPTKFELVINLRTAKSLGLVIPESIVLHADEVIE
jgi:putative ABC transport system substrate-binding protein